MAYRIIETPDHLHRGIHVFAAANLATVLDWLDRHVWNDTLRDARLPTEDRWFLNSLTRHGLVQDVQTRRLLSRKEAQAFFKEHPEFRKGATYRTTPLPSEMDVDEDDLE
jgi:hypothetical protein